MEARISSSNTDQKESEARGSEWEGGRGEENKKGGGERVMEEEEGRGGWWCRGGVCGIWSMFGLEVKAPALGSQEDNGKEREKKGRFMDVCVPSQVVATY